MFSEIMFELMESGSFCFHLVLLFRVSDEKHRERERLQAIAFVFSESANNSCEKESLLSFVKFPFERDEKMHKAKLRVRRWDEKTTKFLLREKQRRNVSTNVGLIVRRVSESRSEKCRFCLNEMRTVVLFQLTSSIHLLEIIDHHRLMFSISVWSSCQILFSLVVLNWFLNRHDDRSIFFSLSWNKTVKDENLPLSWSYLICFTHFFYWPAESQRTCSLREIKNETKVLFIEFHSIFFRLVFVSSKFTRFDVLKWADDYEIDKAQVTSCHHDHISEYLSKEKEKEGEREREI